MFVLRLAVAASLAWVATAGNAQAPRGSDIFDSACAHCHGANGAGGPLAPSILQRVAETDDAELASFLRVGAPDRGMPPAPVSGAEMTALIDYVRFLGSAAGASTGAVVEERGAASPIDSFRPVTDAVLRNPNDGDWLPAARTRDGRPFSPLDQVNATNVPRLALAWARGLPPGSVDVSPIVYAGVMFVAFPGASIAALDAATGDILWQHGAAEDAASRASDGVRRLALAGDSLYVTPASSPPFALDARTGALRQAAAPSELGAASPERQGDASDDGATLRTAGGLLFRAGDDRSYEAVQAESGEVLWRTFLGGPIAAGGISYAVDGRQYFAVIAGGPRSQSASAASPAGSSDNGSSAASGALYVFALPDLGQ